MFFKLLASLVLSIGCFYLAFRLLRSLNTRFYDIYEWDPEPRWRRSVLARNIPARSSKDALRKYRKHAVLPSGLLLQAVRASDQPS